MFNFKIGHRIIGSFLLLTTASLTLLGSYLLYFFYIQNIDNATNHLITNAKIVETMLDPSLESVANRRRLTEDIGKISLATGLRVTIISVNGDVIADSWQNPDTLDNHATRQEVVTASEQASAMTIRYSSSLRQNMMYAAVPYYDGDRLTGIVRTALPMTPIETSFQETRDVILAALFTTTLLTLVIGLWLTLRYTKPIKDMTDGAKLIAAGQLQHRLHVHTGDELELLAHTINQLTSNLEDKINESAAEAHKLSLILKYMNNAVLLLDSYGNIITANDCAQSAFSIGDDAHGHHSVNALGSSLITEYAKTVHKTQHSQSVQLKLELPAGVKTFQCFFAPIPAASAAAAGVLVVFHDISALQAIYERQVEFVANASHELKTPLTAIQGFAETLLDASIGGETATGRKFLTIIYDEAQRMNRLINDLLTMAKLESKDYLSQLKLEPVDIARLLTAVHSDLTPHLARKNLTLEVDLPPCPPIIEANNDWLKQIIVNLTENAVKYSPPGASIIICARQTGGSVSISVEDHGIGIAEADLPFIFDRFYRTDKARTRTEGGFGVGLALAKFIVEMFGGTITAASRPGCGSIFTVTLPLNAGIKPQPKQENSPP